MFYWFINYSHEIVLHVNTLGTDVIGTSLFLGVYISPTDLFPQIIVPHGHVAPYSNPQSGVEAPFFTVVHLPARTHIPRHNWGFRSLY